MTIDVLVPDDAGAALLGDIDGVTVRVWDGVGELPADAAATTVWVPPFITEVDRGRAYDQLPRLEVVQLLTAGAERFIGGTPAGVTLCNARGAHSGPTAEWVVAAMLASYRLFPRFVAAQLEGRWDWAVNEEMGGRSVLVVGAGDIAGRLARMLAGFDMAVTLVGRTARDGVHAVDELPQLLPGADVVVLLIPLTEDTRGLVDADFLARMADGGLLVNAARGGIVDTDALLAELSAGRLRAAVDVTDPEPLPDGHPLWQAPGLLITPHIAGSVPTSAERAYDVLRAQLQRLLAGDELQNVVAEY